ncbi:MAG: acyltransferase [Desulfobacterales bacterium]|nr:acyltransferase [Desulfobacterales bacterium]
MDNFSEDDLGEFKKKFLKVIDNRDNRFHPLVWIHGSPEIGENVYIGGFSEVNAKGSEVVIGDNCDISSFVAINTADSHKVCIGLASETERAPIRIGNNVFIGSHSFIGGGTSIGTHSVVGAGTILSGQDIPPYSLVCGNPPVIKAGYYKDKEKDE